eukprot:TRINITY_DN18599_c0_g1_i1.p1 TRINITY_DN18599_c0_g1~~TRINITY_DN18599_c0_g1_i1.p1  ORF type:complete len:648 (+),score=123.66 TRINITY_DN18599_c0_g1_i1:98-2041(+)
MRNSRTSSTLSCSLSFALTFAVLVLLNSLLVVGELVNQPTIPRTRPHQIKPNIFSNSQSQLTTTGPFSVSSTGQYLYSPSDSFSVPFSSSPPHIPTLAQFQSTRHSHCSSWDDIVSSPAPLSISSSSSCLGIAYTCPSSSSKSIVVTSCLDKNISFVSSEEELFTRPLIIEGKVYVGLREGLLMQDLTSSDILEGQVLGLEEDGHFFFALNSRTLVKRPYPNTLGRVWRSDVPEGLCPSWEDGRCFLNFDSDFVYVYGTNLPLVYVYSYQTGLSRFDIQLDRVPTGKGSLITNEKGKKVIVLPTNQGLDGIEIMTQKRIWTFNAGGQPFPPKPDVDNIIFTYVPATQQAHALDNTGSVLYSVPLLFPENSEVIQEFPRQIVLTKSGPLIFFSNDELFLLSAPSIEIVREDKIRASEIKTQISKEVVRGECVVKGRDYDEKIIEMDQRGSCVLPADVPNRFYSSVRFFYRDGYPTSLEISSLPTDDFGGFNITSLSPKWGSTSGGTQVTVKGNGFNYCANNSISYPCYCIFGNFSSILNKTNSSEIISHDYNIADYQNDNEVKCTTNSLGSGATNFTIAFIYLNDVSGTNTTQLTSNYYTFNFVKMPTVYAGLVVVIIFVVGCPIAVIGMLVYTLRLKKKEQLTYVEL